MAQTKKKLRLVYSKKTDNHPRKRSKLKTILVLGLVVASVLLIMISPLFHITNVEITGNSRYTGIEIREAAGLSQSLTSGESIFLKSSGKIKAGVETLPYVRTAEVKKSYPGKIIIKVIERSVRGYVEYHNMGQYLYIDEYGVVLDIKPYFTEKLPVIVGLSFSDSVIGKALVVENKSAFESVMQLSTLFEKYELYDVIKVDVSDGNNIHLYINHVDVLIGTIDAADEKISVAKACLAEIDESFRGVLDVRDLSLDPVFKFTE